MQKPDFNSYTYNYRQQRFLPSHYPFDPQQGARWCAFPVKPGVLADTNEQVTLTQDNKLMIQLFDQQHDTGFHVDSVGSLYGRWLRSLSPDAWRKDAETCNRVGLLLLDRRVVLSRGNYADSPSEQATPPDASLLPSLEEWIGIWNRANT